MIEDVQKPVRHGRDDLEPRREAVPGGVRDGGREARLGGDWSPIQNARRFGLRQQGQFRALVSPEEDLQGRRPHRRRNRWTHRRRPCPLAIHALRVHQLQLHLRIAASRRASRRPAR